MITTQNRRGFFKGLMMAASGAAAIAAAETKSIVGIAAPVKLTQGVVAPICRTKPYTIENALIVLQDAVDLVALEVNRRVHPHVKVGNYEYKAEYWEGGLVEIAPNHTAKINQRAQARLSPRSFELMFNGNLHMAALLEPCIYTLAEDMSERILCGGNHYLAVCKLPSPLEGTGAVARFSKAPGIQVRGILSYSPATLNQVIIFDILYGVA